MAKKKSESTKEETPKSKAKTAPAVAAVKAKDKPSAGRRKAVAVRGLFRCQACGFRTDNTKDALTHTRKNREHLVRTSRNRFSR